MISAKEALESPKVRLTEKEQTAFQHAEAVITAAIHDHYIGQPFTFRISLAEVPPRAIYAIKRRFEKPAVDGSRWLVALTEERDVLGEVLAVHMLLDAAPPADTLAVEKIVERPPERSILGGIMEEIAALQRGAAAAQAPTLSESPVLSVIFGTYNRIGCLKRAVESVRKSVGDLAYEIVACDGGSVDGSREWLAAQRDVVLIGERHLEGAVKAFNQCYAASRGAFIANLNDDCIVEGKALVEGTRYLQEHPKAGQVALAFRADGEEWHINDIYPRDRYPSVKWPTTYANFGITRRAAADQVVAITGGFWSPVYRTYAADCELSAWIHRLGWEVAKLPHLHVIDVRNDDALRLKNTPQSGLEAKRMYTRWPAEAFRSDGPEPRVSAEELERFRRVKAGLPVAAPTAPTVQVDLVEDIARMVGFPEPGEERRLRALAPRIRALDPVDGQFPKRAGCLHDSERVLHVSLCTDADPQAGLVRALKKLGGYAEVRWFADYGQDREGRQRAILEAAARIKPTFAFMQLQEPNAVDVETVRRLREVADPSCVIATWCGDIASWNNPYDVEWQVALGRVVDLVGHSSMSHVRALRGAGVHNAFYAQIGYDDLQYRLPESL